MSFNTRRSSSHFQVFFSPEDKENENTENPVDILDFVELFPPELSDKLFAYLSTPDVMTSCQVSIKWRHVINNNRQWMNRCKQHNLIQGTLDEADPFKWSELDTHVDAVTLGSKRRASPAFLLPPIASTRITSLCPWGRYFRQCHHLKRNWQLGRNVIHQMNFPDNRKGFDICTTADSNSEYLAMGSNSGSVYLWAISGVPKLRETIPYSTEVQQVRLSSHLLAILYQDGLVRSYKTPPGYSSRKSEVTLDLLLQFRVWGLPTPNIQNEYTLFTQEVEPQSQIVTPRISVLETSGPSLEVKGEDATVDIQTPALEQPNAEPWLDTDYLASDLIFLITEKHLVISGCACNCFLLFGFETKEFLKKVQVPQGVQACRNAFVTPSAIYLTAKKRRMNQRFDTTISIFVYDYEDPWEFIEFRSQDLTEEIRIDPKNPDKVVWIAQDSIIYAADLITQELIFTKSSEAYVDSLVVNGDYIVYHQYDGFVTALNWAGEAIYVAEAPGGISRGFQCFSDFLVMAGDGLQLSVYNVHRGELLHKILYRPVRVEYLFIHDTKIICIGRDEPAVLIGYW